MVLCCWPTEEMEKKTASKSGLCLKAGLELQRGVWMIKQKLTYFLFILNNNKRKKHLVAISHQDLEAAASAIPVRESYHRTQASPLLTHCCCCSSAPELLLTAPNRQQHKHIHKKMKEKKEREKKKERTHKTGKRKSWGRNNHGRRTNYMNKQPI